MPTLIEKRTRKPFRVYGPSPSWMQEEQIVTPRQWTPPKEVTGWHLLKFFGKCLFGLALIAWLLWGWPVAERLSR